MNEDFITIVRDSDAVEKIAQAIKDKQDSVKSGGADNALVSDTTKKVATGTFNAGTENVQQVMLDFMDELQSSILQIKLNLSREYEKRKIEH